jgi:hypothetical protein
MRKIDKQCHLSTVYKTWESSLTADHPTYSHSTTKRLHYNSIVMQLLFNQDGLCAFTEERICPKNDKTYSDNNWADGIYNIDKPDISGDLEHFNSSLKEKQGWLWDNFFVVSSFINRKKGTKEVDSILKPDDINYEASKMLDYNPTTNFFTPHTELTDTEKDRVQKMIDTLEINNGLIVDKRERFLNKIFLLSDFGVDLDIDEFPTAYEMTSILKETNNEGSILDTL